MSSTVATHCNHCHKKLHFVGFEVRFTFTQNIKNSYCEQCTDAFKGASIVQYSREFPIPDAPIMIELSSDEDKGKEKPQSSPDFASYSSLSSSEEGLEQPYFMCEMCTRFGLPPTKVTEESRGFHLFYKDGGEAYRCNACADAEEHQGLISKRRLLNADDWITIAEGMEEYSDDD